MSSVGIKELKNRLTYYIRLAKQGEELVVTERGKPVVLMQGLTAAKDVTSLDARLARLAVQGIAALPVRHASKQVKPKCIPGKAISRIILDQRR